eukprot:5589856-Pleurochrysis_carterae.AAC.1
MHLPAEISHSITILITSLRGGGASMAEKAQRAAKAATTTAQRITDIPRLARVSDLWRLSSRLLSRRMKLEDCCWTSWRGVSRAGAGGRSGGG